MIGLIILTIIGIGLVFAGLLSIDGSAGVEPSSIYFTAGILISLYCGPKWFVIWMGGLDVPRLLGPLWRIRSSKLHGK